MIGYGFVIHGELDNVIAARAGGLRGPMHAIDVESLSCRVALQWPRRNIKCFISCLLKGRRTKLSTILYKGS